MILDRSHIPFNHSGIILNIPEIDISSLGNIKIYKYQDKSQPLVNFKINFKKGASSDNIPGTANFTMAMLQSGTSNKNASEISNVFESVGASYFFNAYWDECAFGFSTLGHYFENCLEMTAECIFDSVLDDSEFKRQKDKISAEIMQSNADPNYITQLAFNKEMYGNHPYSNARIGSLNEVAQINQSDIANFYNELINESDVSIIVTGNFVHSEVDSKIKSLFTKLMTNKSKQGPSWFVPSAYTHVISPKDDALQTNLRIGRPSIDRQHSDYPAFQIINTVFGGYFLSRLNQVLREEKGLTYGIYSYLDMRKLSSVFTIATGINKDKTFESIEDILNISLDISRSKLSETEIERSIEFMTGSFARSLETPKQITGLIQALDSFELDRNFLIEFYKKIRQLSADEIFEVQKKYFSEPNYLIAASGDSEYLSDIISKFGNFKIIEI
ncbi:MAG: pitrilysin family protein [Candidatus Kapabacteria bacterium]|jgi:predicted Zn-dependent peptidase|nr:pitrilysin family protein [Candidatus Kapabacteria bacterium]